jgi:hypothetical protein
MMAGITSMFGMSSSRTEISDEEVSEASEVEAPVQVEKKGKKGSKAAVKEENSLMVESDNNREEDDEEIGEDECVPIDL